MDWWSDLDLTRRLLEGPWESFSIDVFDTTLVRTVLKPEHIFLQLEERLQIAGLARWRRRAHARAWSRRTRGEVSLNDIYRALGELSALDAQTLERCLELELELEAESFRPVERVVLLLQRLRAAAKTVVFLSDTYFERDFVIEQLERVGAFRPADRLYTSLDWGVSKHQGDLFRLLVEREGGPTERWLHLGDNLKADVAKARRCGLAAEHFRDSRPNRHEKRLPWKVGGRGRAVRLGRYFDEPRSQTAFEIGASLAGPLLTAFVLWTLQRAQQRGCRRLFFVARDGRVLLEIAQRLAAKLPHSPELHYLHGSRHAWFAPANSLQPIDLHWVLLWRHRLTPARVAQRLRVDPELGGDPDRILTEEEVQRLVDSLRQGALRRKVLQVSAAERQAMIGYMEQQGVTLPDTALVDVGWTGRMARALATVLQARAPYWYFLGIQPTAASMEPVWQGEYFLFGPEHGNLRSLSLMPLIVELFTIAEEGRTLGYRATESGFEPLLAAVKPSSHPAILEAVKAGILDFAQHCQVADFEQLEATPYRQAMQDFMASPSRAEAETFGNFPNHLESNEEPIFSLTAPPLSLAQTLFWLYLTHKPSRFREMLSLTTWVEASCLRSPWYCRLLLRPYLALIHLLDPYTPGIRRLLGERAAEAGKPGDVL